MTKQAPLPWTITQNSWQYTTVYDAEGNAICRLDLEDWSVTEENQDALEKVQTQIASRIICSVNNHSALVEALEGFVGMFSSQAPGSIGDEVLQKAKTALKTAQGKQE